MFGFNDESDFLLDFDRDLLMFSKNIFNFDQFRTLWSIFVRFEAHGPSSPTTIPGTLAFLVILAFRESWDG